MKCDAHLHLYDLAQKDPLVWDEFKKLERPAMVSHYSEKEHLYYLEKRREGYKFDLSLGIHPQEPLWIHGEILKKALTEGSIGAIGECGWDFFHSRTPEEEKIQDEIFSFQLELAIKYELPLILHLRKAVDKVFSQSRNLKKVKTVIFHSWPAPYHEAQSILKMGINAYFSFGNPLIQGNKKAQETLKRLPKERILMETDAPWQVLKGELYTPLSALDRIYVYAAGLREVNIQVWEDQVADNYSNAYPRV